MKPGRELDLKVAIALGWTVDTDMGNATDPADKRKIFDDPKRSWLPYYSTNMNAAWPLVERFDLLNSENGHMLCKHRGGWHIANGDTGAGWEFSGESFIGESAPHVICLAFLSLS